MDQKIKNLFNLTANYLYGTDYPIDEEALDFKYFYKIGKNNNTLALFADAFEGYLKDEELKEQYSKASVLSLRKKLLFEKERNLIISKLKERHVRYLLLKGLVTEKLYPSIADREMSDNDIFYDLKKKEEVLEVFKELNYEVFRFGFAKDDVFYKEPIYNFEMHRYFVSHGEGETIYNYYLELMNKLDKDESDEWILSNEDAYIYIIVHLYKHYSNFGTGIKCLFDISLFNTAYNLNYDYIEKETKKLDIYSFEINLRNLSSKLLHNNFVLNEEEKEMFEKIYASSTYGNIDTMIQNSLKEENKKDYILERLFLPETTLKEMYPFFYKHKNLRFLLVLYRLARSVTTSRKRILKEVKLLLKYSKK